MKELVLIPMLVLSFLLQDKPESAKPKTAAVALQRDILKEQLAEKQIQADYTACQTRPWATDFKVHEDAIAKLTDDAFKQAGLDKKDWDLNLSTFEFTKKK